MFYTYYQVISDYSNLTNYNEGNTLRWGSLCCGENKTIFVHFKQANWTFVSQKLTGYMA